MENKQSRFKSKVLWMSLLPVIILLGDTFGLWNIVGVNKEAFTQIFVSILSFLVVAGILNNPENPEKF